MKIAFLLGSAAISGGTYVIFEHAARLQKRGHQLIILTKETVAPSVYAWHPAAADLGWLNYEEAQKEHFDILLATWWQSPFLLKDFAASHYVYFIQSIETRFFEPADPADYGTQDHAIWQQLCEKTYSFAIPMITEARWIQEYLLEKYNAEAALVRNGIRKDIYTREGSAVAPVEPGKLRVLVEGPVDVGYKNVPLSIQLARQAGVDEIWLLTSSDIAEFSGVDRVFSRVPIHETPAIYRSCDVLVKLSYVEGMFGPPLEMFHCGGTAIVYKVTGHDEYIVHEQNSLVVERDDEQGVVQSLQKLKNDPSMLAGLRQGARETARQWPDWEHCAGEFEKVLQDIARQRKTSREYLKRYTKEVLDMAIPLTKEKTLDRFSRREKKFARSEATDKHNFVELYWHCADNFKSENVKWKYYPSEQWVDVSFDIEVTGFPFWIRIDPCTRVGCVEFGSICVTNPATGKLLMEFQTSDDYAVLLVCGTAYWIDHARKNVIFSFGADPAVVLPALQEGEVALGDTVRIAMRLRETSLQQFYQESEQYYAAKHQEQIAGMTMQPVSCKQKFMQFIKRLPQKMLP